MEAKDAHVAIVITCTKIQILSLLSLPFLKDKKNLLFEFACS
jgi:hypothetical protein